MAKYEILNTDLFSYKEKTKKEEKTKEKEEEKKHKACLLCD